ncbi:ANTAR domain-containing protein [Streptomyces sp. M10(2022)]
MVRNGRRQPADTAQPPPQPLSPASARTAALEKEIAELRHALVSRPVLDIARGIVMATGQCTAAQAWQVLVDTSQRTNTKLRDLASGIVASVDGPPPSEPIRIAMRDALGRVDAAGQDR